ncbi:hypothetical protein IID62_08385, partial [candidate division KSB1 bacterium]|nr:hypothetical protein [candidate division KSB1 bacterium]
MTSGNITTGSNVLQLGTTEAATLTRTAGMVVGNLYRQVDTDPATVVTVTTATDEVAVKVVDRPLIATTSADASSVSLPSIENSVLSAAVPVTAVKVSAPIVTVSAGTTLDSVS